MLDQRTFEGPEALAAALAIYVAEGIAARLARDGRAAIAVSGGRTPTRFFEALSDIDMDWAKVLVTLVDERWVPETSDRSNGALVRRHLIRHKAALASFVPLYRETATPDESLGLVARTLADMPLPFAAVVLGMGDDGHTASFFPGGDRLADAIDPIGGAAVAAIRAPGAGEPRITLTLPMLLGADRLALHVEGAGKKAVLEQALAGGDPMEMPVRAVLTAERPPVVFWCG